MIETKTFYEKNEHFLNSEVNVLFEDLLEMNPDEFTQWVIDMRKTVVDIWDTYDIPPRRGKDESSIIDQFNKMVSYPVHEFTHTDELSNVEDDVIINKSRIGAIILKRIMGIPFMICLQRTNIKKE